MPCCIGCSRPKLLPPPWPARSNRVAAWSSNSADHGNIRILVEGAYRALRQLGVQQPERLNPWYFPSIAEYSAILERCGIEVTYALLFDRPTPLQDGERGLENWFRMFGGRFMEPLADSQHAEFFRLVSGLRRALPAARRQLVRRLPPPAHRRAQIAANRSPSAGA